MIPLHPCIFRSPSIFRHPDWTYWSESCRLEIFEYQRQGRRGLAGRGWVRHLNWSWRCHGGSWGAFWGALGGSCRVLEASWRLWEASWRHLGANVKLKAPLGGSWRASWEVLEASWGRLGGVLGGLRRSWRPLGGVLEAISRILEAS